jgi:hypothetical protein
MLLPDVGCAMAGVLRRSQVRRRVVPGQRAAGPIQFQPVPHKLRPRQCGADRRLQGAELRATGVASGSASNLRELVSNAGARPVRGTPFSRPLGSSPPRSRTVHNR